MSHKKDKTQSSKFSKEEIQRIKEKAKEEKMTVSKLIRKVTLNHVNGRTVETQKVEEEQKPEQPSPPSEKIEEEKPEAPPKSREEQEQEILDSGSWIKESKPDKQGYQWRYVATYQCDSKRKGQAWCDRLHSFEEAHFFAKAKLDAEAKQEERKLERLSKQEARKTTKDWETQKTSLEIADQLGICENPILTRQKNSIACHVCKKRHPAKHQACEEITRELKMSPVAYNKFIKAMTAKEQDWFQVPKTEDMTLEEMERELEDPLSEETIKLLAYHKRYQEVCEPCEELREHRCSKYCKEFYEGLNLEASD